MWLRRRQQSWRRRRRDTRHREIGSVTEPDVAVMNAVLVGGPDAEIVALEAQLRAAQLAADVSALDRTHRRRAAIHRP